MFPSWEKQHFVTQSMKHLIITFYCQRKTSITFICVNWLRCFQETKTNKEKKLIGTFYKVGEGHIFPWLYRCLPLCIWTMARMRSYDRSFSALRWLSTGRETLSSSLSQPPMFTCLLFVIIAPLVLLSRALVRFFPVPLGQSEGSRIQLLPPHSPHFNSIN